MQLTIRIFGGCQFIRDNEGTLLLFDMTNHFPLPGDQTTTFRSGVFENRGQWLGQAQRVIAAKLINTGSVAVASLVFDVDHLVNRGTFQVSAGNLSGRIGVLDNDAILQVLAGLFDVTFVDFEGPQCKMFCLNCCIHIFETHH